MILICVLLIAILGALTYFVIQGLKKGFDLMKKVIVGILCAACCLTVVALFLKKKNKKHAK